MKRFLAILLVLSLLLVPMAVFAEDEGEVTDPPVTEAPVEPEPLPVAEIKKHLANPNSVTNPPEKFEFVFEAHEDGWPAIPNVIVPYAKGQVGTVDGTINLDNFADAAIGRYTYTVTEIVNDTAGMTYSTRVGELTVDKTVDGIASYLIIRDGESKKHDNFDNEFLGGNLLIRKALEGNMTDPNKEFTVVVTLTAPEGKTVKTDAIYVSGSDDEVTFEDGVAIITFTIKGGETVTISNLPYGALYEVEETESFDYTVRYDDNKDGKIDAEDIETVITNTKSVEVPTGITLDNMPYIILMAVALVGLGAFALRKRAQN